MKFAFYGTACAGLASAGGTGIKKGACFGRALSPRGNVRALKTICMPQNGPPCCMEDRRLTIQIELYGKDGAKMARKPGIAVLAAQAVSFVVEDSASERG